MEQLPKLAKNSIRLFRRCRACGKVSYYDIAHTAKGMITSQSGLECKHSQAHCAQAITQDEALKALFPDMFEQPLCYVILEYNWQYKDENYEQSDSGSPKYVYSDRQAAEDMCFHLNHIQLSGLEVNYYEFDHNMLWEEVPDLLVGENRWDYKIKDDLTASDARRIMSFIGKYPFYYVKEVLYYK